MLDKWITHFSTAPIIVQLVPLVIAVCIGALKKDWILAIILIFVVFYAYMLF